MGCAECGPRIIAVDQSNNSDLFDGFEDDELTWEEWGLLCTDQVGGRSLNSGGNDPSSLNIELEM